MSLKFKSKEVLIALQKELGETRGSCAQQAAAMKTLEAKLREAEKVEKELTFVNQALMVCD